MTYQQSLTVGIESKTFLLALLDPDNLAKCQWLRFSTMEFTSKHSQLLLHSHTLEAWPLALIIISSLNYQFFLSKNYIHSVQISERGIATSDKEKMYMGFYVSCIPTSLARDSTFQQSIINYASVTISISLLNLTYSGFVFIYEIKSHKTISYTNFSHWQFHFFCLLCMNSLRRQ